MTAQVQVGSTYLPQTLSFGTISVGDAPGTLYTPVTQVTSYRMAADGWVIGMAANLDGTLATGTLQFTPTKNGSVMSGTFSNGTINIGTLGNHERVQAQNPLFQFRAGDNIGLMFNKTGTVTPTTRNAEVLLIVLLAQYDY